MPDTFWELTLFSIIWPLVVTGLVYIRIITIINKITTVLNDNLNILVEQVPGIKKEEEDE